MPGNAAPVRFALTEQMADSASFENPAHDFPQKISYRRQGEVLYAITSGDGRQIEFAFRLH